MASNRRTLMKFAVTSVGSLIAGAKLLDTPPAHAKSSCLRREESGANLSGWEVVLGDALDTCLEEAPVTRDDIETIHAGDHSELRANIKLRHIMAHNITFKRIIDEHALHLIHTCKYKFRIPFILEADASKNQNGETFESGIFVWDGGNTKLDYGIGFQWILNPFPGAGSGDIRTWNGNAWVRVGHLAPDTEWHEIIIVVDYRRTTTALLIDGAHIPTQLSKTPKSGFGPETAARLQAEIVSINPKPNCTIAATHKAQVKDWYWAWEYPNQVFMPFITYTPHPTLSIPLTPISTPEPTITPTVVSCSTTKITVPVSEANVTSPFTVSWVPDLCVMVLQFYQNGKLISEDISAKSGQQWNILPGRTEIKLWKSGDSVPADNIWVTVK